MWDKEKKSKQSTGKGGIHNEILPTDPEAIAELFYEVGRAIRRTREYPKSKRTAS